MIWYSGGRSDAKLIYQLLQQFSLSGWFVVWTKTDFRQAHRKLVSEPFRCRTIQYQQPRIVICIRYPTDNP